MGHLPDELAWMNSGMGASSLGKRRNAAKDHKWYESVEGKHNPPCLEGAWQIKEDTYIQYLQLQRYKYVNYLSYFTIYTKL